MALTTHPFHPETGDLLPAFRDAYLRGDLSPSNAALVDGYLRNNPEKGDAALHRLQQLHTTGHQMRPSSWLQQQLHFIHAQPQRFQRRAGVAVLVAALVSGAVFAGTRIPTDNTPVGAEATATEAAASTAEASSTMYLSTVTGRILDENGHPLVGATVLDKTSGRGVSTDANGNYSLLIPSNQVAKLQYGYAGYSEEEMLVKGRRSNQNMTLLPKQAAKHKRSWWIF